MHGLATNVLVSEYEAIIAGVGEEAGDDSLIAALVREADWTDRGAAEVLQLARVYGTSILRNALALARAMGIEDGESGL